MSQASSIQPAILEIILIRLATFFLAGTGGDATAARQAARQMIAAYNPRTEEELCLAANIVAFTFQSLEALAQASDPQLPLTRILQLRSGAVSLSREAGKARRGLAQLQKPQPRPEPHPQPEPKPAAIEKTPPQAAPIKLTPPQTPEQRATDARIAANVKRAEAIVAMHRAQAHPPTQQRAP